MTDSRRTTVSATEACEIAHISYRQLDYWLREGVVDMVDPTPGSGRRRRLPVELVDVLIVLGRVSASLTSYHGAWSVSTAVLRRVADNYDRGAIDLGYGVVLTWTAHYRQRRPLDDLSVANNQRDNRSR